MAQVRQHGPRPQCPERQASEAALDKLRVREAGAREQCSFLGNLTFGLRAVLNVRRRDSETDAVKHMTAQHRGGARWPITKCR
ncbi:hypothetical protein SKAU_G00321430 [Synaphobranchus kaupii]|uniref:Uncharacterized protein n=1 Tax=Synaphobranchus kaupii TaxID=118154 RepID=A0A9Q1ENR2_SYNKA|nr:hypothetical protein SKAU_G00321430 [Synaphobranchus kaupii]